MMTMHVGPDFYQPPGSGRGGSGNFNSIGRGRGNSNYRGRGGKPTRGHVGGYNNNTNTPLNSVLDDALSNYRGRGGKPTRGHVGRHNNNTNTPINSALDDALSNVLSSRQNNSEHPNKKQHTNKFGAFNTSTNAQNDNAIVNSSNNHFSNNHQQTVGQKRHLQPFGGQNSNIDNQRFPNNSNVKPGKPTFRNQNTAFDQAIGASHKTKQSASAFGVSAFGNNNNSSFGGNIAQPAFGNNNNLPFGGNTSQSAFNGNVAQPAFSENIAQPAFGTSSNSAFGANTSQPAFANNNSSPFGGNTVQPAFGNSSNSAFGGNTGQPAFSGNIAQPAFGTSINSAFGGNTSQPAFNGNVAQPAFNGNVAQPAFSGNIAQSAFGTSSNSAFGGNTSQPAFANNNSSPFGGNTVQPAFGTSSNSAFGGNTGGPAFGATKNNTNSTSTFTISGNSLDVGTNKNQGLVSNNVNSRVTPPRNDSVPGHVKNTVQKRAGVQKDGAFKKQQPNKIVQEEARSSGQVTASERAARFGGTSRTLFYEQLKKSRVHERQQAIDDGLMQDPDKPTKLENAINFRGTCETKCPEFEMVEREIQNNLDPLEMDEDGNADPEKVVKAYKRSAAGSGPSLPSDVLTPKSLVFTLDYLVDQVLSHHPLEKCHTFIWDRTRSIRNDFTLQNIRDLTAVQVHERIARFHIMSLHEMCSLEDTKFSEQQEMEQLRKVLLSLIEFYDDLREEGIETENEAEFRAYNLINHIRDQEVARQAMTLPAYIFRHPYVTRALQFHAFAQRSNEIKGTSSRRNLTENIEASQNFYSAFFKLIADPETPFLMSSLLECHFADIRKSALKAMNVSYNIKAGGIAAEYVRQVLAYDTLKQLLDEANLYGLVIDMSLGEPTICFGEKYFDGVKNKSFPFFIEPKTKLPRKKSLLLVEPKKAGRTYSEIINGENSNITPLPNQNVFARQTVPVKSKFNSKDLTSETGITLEDDQLLQQREAEQLAKQKELEEARAKAKAATAAAVAERRKMEELLERKAEQKRQEALLLQEQERQQHIQEQRRKEKEEENAALQEKRVQEQRLKQMTEMRKNATKSQLCNRWFTELMDSVMEEQVREAVQRTMNLGKYMKQRMKPWIFRARSRISKRNVAALDRSHNYHFNMMLKISNPYSSFSEDMYKARPLHSTTAGIRERVNQSVQAQRAALENIKHVGSLTQSLTGDENDQVAVWRKEDFAFNNIYPRIRDKMIGFEKEHPGHAKLTWQLLISVEDPTDASSSWYKYKFGLDDMFSRNVCRYKAFNIITRITTTQSVLSSQTVDETGAIIFSLPESRDYKEPQEFEAYWKKCKGRFDTLTTALQHYNPGIQIPVLFTYFPDSSSTEASLAQLPLRLGLDTNRAVSDYHILIMKPETIAARIVDEVNWLSRNTVINQY